MPDAINIPTVKTARLTLVPLDFSHSTGMFDLWSSEAVCRYSGDVTDYQRNPIEMPAKSSHESDRIIDFWQQAALDGWGFRWAVMAPEKQKHEQVFVGTVGFNSLEQCSEVAYHLIPIHWGHGLMSEATAAAIDWRTKTVQSIRTHCEFEAFIEPGNVPSIALATRFGFQPTDYVSDGARRYLRR